APPAGPLPGSGACYGSAWMPEGFGEGLFGGTRLGRRVIVAPTEVAPVEIAHQALFSPKPGAGAVAAARAAEAADAARHADQARLAAATVSRETARAMTPVRMAGSLKLRAVAQLAARQRA